MAIPLRYNLRNLVVRWHSTMATALGIALVVAVFVMVMSLARGLAATYISTGDPRNLLVLRKGSTAESSSQITPNEVRQIRYLAGIDRNASGEPLASPEIQVLVQMDRRDQTGTAHVLMRGLSPVGIELRPQIAIRDGRIFRQGLNECIVSQRIAQRFAHCGIGDQFAGGKAHWTVVGIFAAAKTAYESEIWVDADEARAAFNRSFYGSILLRATTDATAVATLTNRIESNRDLSVRVLPETEYYKEQTNTGAPIQFLGSFLAIVMSIGAVFSAMNTMYATVVARSREIGTLRVLGYKRRDIYISFMIESVLLALLGGALGCVFSLPLNGLATGTLSWNSFTEVAFEFRITGELLAKGMAFALVMGVLGGLLPARLAARKPVLDALRAM